MGCSWIPVRCFNDKKYVCENGVYVETAEACTPLLPYIFVGLVGAGSLVGLAYLATSKQTGRYRRRSRPKKAAPQYRRRNTKPYYKTVRTVTCYRNGRRVACNRR